jgi:hypothetical protein
MITGSCGARGIVTPPPRWRQRAQQWPTCARSTHGRRGVLGDGVVTGPDERVVEVLPGAAISGRVIDEGGEPLARAHVEAVLPDHPWDPVQRATTLAVGAFRLHPVDPTGRTW